MNLDLLLVCKTDKQIQIGLPVIWTGHARLKRHYVKAFYISFVTLIKILKERPIFHVEILNTRVSAGVRKSLLSET